MSVFSDKQAKYFSAERSRYLVTSKPSQVGAGERQVGVGGRHFFPLLFPLLCSGLLINDPPAQERRRLIPMIDFLFCSSKLLFRHQSIFLVERIPVSRHKLPQRAIDTAMDQPKHIVC